MLLLNSAPGPLTGQYYDRTRSVLSMPGPAAEKPRVYAIWPGKKFLKGRYDCGLPEWAVPALREAEDEIRVVLGQYRRAIVVAAVSYGVGSGVPLLARWLREMGIAHTILAGTPYVFEGKRKKEIALDILNELQGSPVIEVPYEEVKQRAKDEGIRVTLKNAFELANQELCCRLEQLLAQNGLL